MFQMLSDIEIENQIALRSKAKSDHDFFEADRIREYLLNNYVQLHDAKGVTTFIRLLPPERIRINFGESFDRDWEFYFTNKEKFNFSGSLPEEFIEDLEEGYTGKECFYVYEAQGIKLSCKELKLLQEIVNCKRSVNLHLKMWSEGFSDMCEPIDYYLNEFIGQIPDWVKLSLKNQVEMCLCGVE